jgi:hypothetical protein
MVQQARAGRGYDDDPVYTPEAQPPAPVQQPMDMGPVRGNVIEDKELPDTFTTMPDTQGTGRKVTDAFVEGVDPFGARDIISGNAGLGNVAKLGSAWAKGRGGLGNFMRNAVNPGQVTADMLTTGAKNELALNTGGVSKIAALLARIAGAGMGGLPGYAAGDILGAGLGSAAADLANMRSDELNREWFEDQHGAGGWKGLTNPIDYIKAGRAYDRWDMDRNDQLDDMAFDDHMDSMVGTPQDPYDQALQRSTKYRSQRPDLHGPMWDAPLDPDVPFELPNSLKLKQGMPSQPDFPDIEMGGLEEDIGMPEFQHEDIVMPEFKAPERRKLSIPGAQDLRTSFDKQEFDIDDVSDLDTPIEAVDQPTGFGSWIAQMGLDPTWVKEHQERMKNQKTRAWDPNQTSHFGNWIARMRPAVVADRIAAAKTAAIAARNLAQYQDPTKRDPKDRTQIEDRETNDSGHSGGGGSAGRGTDRDIDPREYEFAY